MKHAIIEMLIYIAVFAFIAASCWGLSELYSGIHNAMEEEVETG